MEKNINSRKLVWKVSALLCALTYSSAIADDDISNNTVDETVIDSSDQGKDFKLIMSCPAEVEVLEDESALYYISEDPSFASFYAEWGLLGFLGSNNDERLSISAVGSRTLNFSLCYNMVFPESHFAILLGGGYSSSTLSFKEYGDKYYSISRHADEKYTEVEEAIDLFKHSRAIKEFNGSYLHRHFVEIMLGGKFFVDKLYPKDSFSFYLGMKFGILVSSNTELVYAQDHAAKSVIFYDKYNLKDLKIGVTAKAAWRRFGVFYDIDLTNLFASSDDGLQGPAMKYLQKVGIFVDIL